MRIAGRGRFLVLGSASPDLVSAKVVHLKSADRLWLRGGLPPSYEADTDALSADWREDYIRTFVECDLGALGFRLPAVGSISSCSCPKG